MSRERVLAWFRSALAAVDPRSLTAAALARGEPATTVIAVGKAARAMAWGAADALGEVTGVCVSDSHGAVPGGIELIVGDHPIPGPASFAAGHRVLEAARSCDGRCVVLLSGGGSALCEQPIHGVPAEFLADATRALLAGGASIGETNLVRGQLSAIKDGGLARAAGGAVDTLVLMDVSGLGPETVASGPTLSSGARVEEAVAVLQKYGVTVPPGIEQAMRAAGHDAVRGPVRALADGRDAAHALAQAARDDGIDASVASGWLDGEVTAAVARFIGSGGPGVTVAAGETTVEVTGNGRGGRNTHAALLAARKISGTGAVFGALATDGVDGGSGAAGAVVDGGTLDRGGDPAPELAAYDSATYLERSGDLVVTGPTGTNVADLWVLWRP